MTSRFVKPDRPRPLWQTFLAPMLLASLGLHGLLLMLPAGSSGDAVIPPPDPEQDSVAITRVPPPGSANAGAAGLGGAPIAGVTPIPGSAGTPGSTGQPLVGGVASGQAPRSSAAPVRSQPPAPPRSPSGQSPRVAAPQPPSSPPTAAPPGTTGGAVAPPSRPLFNAEVGERLLAYVAALNLPPGQIERAAASVQDRFGYNAAAVTRDTFNTNKAQWESAIQQETGIATLAAEDDRTSDFLTVYPQRVCLVEEPGEIKIGALVNPDGSWRGAPRLLRSSGYAALDRKALQDIQSHRFTPADSITAYVLTVSTTVDYGRRPCIPATPGP